MPLSLTGLVTGINRGLAGWGRGRRAAEQTAYEREQNAYERQQAEAEAKRRALMDELQASLAERAQRTDERRAATDEAYRQALAGQAKAYAGRAERQPRAPTGGGRTVRTMSDRDLIALQNQTGEGGNSPNPELNAVVTRELARRAGAWSERPAQASDFQVGPPSPQGTSSAAPTTAADYWEWLRDQGVSPESATVRTRARFPNAGR